jgi:cytoskeleton-associated protein 5
MQGRLADSNRNLAAKALTVVGDIARAMGPTFDKQGRMLLGPALANLSDNKKQVR